MPWRQLPDNSYVLHTSITHAYVEQDTEPPNQWFIKSTFNSGEVLRVSAPFATQVAAQAALNAFVASTGGT